MDSIESREESSKNVEQSKISIKSEERKVILATDSSSYAKLYNE